MSVDVTSQVNTEWEGVSPADITSVDTKAQVTDASADEPSSPGTSAHPSSLGAGSVADTDIDLNPSVIIDAGVDAATDSATSAYTETASASAESDASAESATDGDVLVDASLVSNDATDAGAPNTSTRGTSTGTSDAGAIDDLSLYCAPVLDQVNVAADERANVLLSGDHPRATGRYVHRELLPPQGSELRAQWTASPVSTWVPTAVLPTIWAAFGGTLYIDRQPVDHDGSWQDLDLQFKTLVRSLIGSLERGDDGGF